MYLVRGGRSASTSATSSSSWLTPAQRVVRVLEVTRANWPILAGGRRRKRRGAGTAFVREENEESLHI